MKRFARTIGFTSLYAVVVLALAACGTSEPDGSRIKGTLEGRKMSEGEVRTAIRDAGFPASVINKMVCTAWYESNWYTAAHNRNRNGSVDIGMLQINSVHWQGCGATRSALTNPATNARCGLRVFNSQGLNAWYGYRSHRTRCNSYGGGRLPLGGAVSEELATLYEQGNGVVDPDAEGYVDEADAGNDLEIPEL